MIRLFSSLFCSPAFLSFFLSFFITQRKGAKFFCCKQLEEEERKKERKRERERERERERGRKELFQCFSLFPFHERRDDELPSFLHSFNLFPKQRKKETLNPLLPQLNSSSMSERFELGCSLENSLLGISSSSSNNFRPDHHHHHLHQSHVAQQSRREKLRVPPLHHQITATGSSSSSGGNHLIQDFGNHLLQQFPNRYSNQGAVGGGGGGDFVHVRSNGNSIKNNNCDLLYDPTPMLFSSEMLNFSSSAHPHQGHHHGGHLLLAQSGKAAATAVAVAVGPVSAEEEENTTTVSSSSHIVPTTNIRFHHHQHQSQTQQQQQQNGGGGGDWMSNFVGGSGVGGVCSNQNPILIGGEILPPPPPRNMKQTDFFYMKSASTTVAVVGSGCNNEYQEEDVQSPLTTTTTSNTNTNTNTNTNRSISDISNQDCCQKSYGGEVNFSSRSPLFYQTDLLQQQQQVSSTTPNNTLGTTTQSRFETMGGCSGGGGGVHHHVQQQQQKIQETGHGSWVDGGNNELVLLPRNYVNQNNHHPSHDQLMEEEQEEEGEEEEEQEEEVGTTHHHHHHQWNGGGGNLESIVVGESTTNQGLSLSLSSYPELHAAAAAAAAVPHQFGERFGSENIQARPAAAAAMFSTDSQDLKPNDAGYMVVSNSRALNIVNADHKGGHGNFVEGIGGCSAAYARHCTGPLGPFTGYATILKNSKFLKPAQQLLEEFCTVNGPKIIKSCEVLVKNNCSNDVSVLSDALNSDNGNGGSGGRDGNSGGSSSFFSTSDAAAAAAAAAGSDVGRPCQSAYRPDFQQKKAKLMYMLEEVCRRYKQYHQQMQMVVSSFETVAGLDAATPYTSLALKTVSKHFRSLKNTIADQLSLMKKALGEDLSSPTSGTNNNKGDATVPRLRFINQSLGKQGAAGNSLGFLEPQQQVWRPQRGLPERSVAVLKAWLFEHFLHPYPTDTDKHMLASQTGLTRNQVSNWFINARVRVWKPMVEEMHMLETKGTAETDLNCGSSILSCGDVSGRNTNNQSSNMLMINAMSEKVHECSTMGLTSNPEVGQSSENWHQDKRSRMDCQIQPGVLDGGLMGFVPYHHQRALEIGGIGSVSLTLGLRHSTGNVQQQQQQQQQQHPDHQLNRHYGGQMLHDFVG